MKSWLLKFKISNALNEGRPLPPELAKTVASSKTARDFAESASTLARALKNQALQCEVPSSLHQSIMRTVRAESRSQNAAPVFWPRWIPVSSFACLVVLAFVIAVHNSNIPPASVTQSEARAIYVADSALEFGGNIVRQAPDAAISPLEDEMQAMHHDLDRTKDFLIASLP